MAVKIIVRFICAGCGKVEELTSAKVNSWGYFWRLKDEETPLLSRLFGKKKSRSGTGAARRRIKIQGGRIPCRTC